jgi:hypothetical protein
MSRPHTQMHTCNGLRAPATAQQLRNGTGRNWGRCHTPEGARAAEVGRMRQHFANEAATGGRSARSNVACGRGLRVGVFWCVGVSS